MFEDFNLNKRDKYYLLFLTIFSTVLTAYYINFNLNLGISCSDVYIYLLNALYFTGTNIHATENVFLSPVVCFLTSILFRLGLVDKLAIYIVTGALAIIGNIGLYLLLRQYFDEILSTTGVIVYATLSLSLTWLANGSLDIPAVSFSIWLMLFSIIAIKQNPKFYTYASIMFVLGFFTRYTVVLTIPAILIYYIYENGFTIKESDRKPIAKAIIIGAILGIMILAAVIIMGHGSFGAGTQMVNRASGKSGAQTDPAFNPDYSYYLDNMPNFISNSHTVFDGNPVLQSPTILSWIVILILIVGVLLWMKDRDIKLEKKYAIPVALFIISFFIFKKVSPLITIALITAGFYLAIKETDNKIGVIMLVWITANIIFFSYYNIKVNRYIIPIFPPAIYFLVRSIDFIQKNIKINKNIIPIILIGLFMIQGFAFTLTFEPTDEYLSTEDISNYIIDNNPDYKNMSIGVYNIRPFSWWLGANVTGLPVDNQSEIDSSNCTYYISNSELNDLKNYTEIKKFDELHLYEKISS